MKFFWFVLCLLPATVWAESVDICYNYDCAVHAKVQISNGQLRNLRKLFSRVRTAQQERVALSRGVGLLEIFAAKQTPTGKDKGGNLADNGVDGRMDCLDHSHNTTAYLQLMRRNGLLSFHDVLEPVMRAPYVLNAHWAAQIVEHPSGQKFVVDSWFLDNGASAVVYPLQAWLNGASPDE